MAWFGELGEAVVDIADLAGMSNAPPSRRTGAPPPAIDQGTSFGIYPLAILGTLRPARYPAAAHTGWVVSRRGSGVHLFTRW